MSDLQALMPEGTQHLIEKIKAEKEDTFRFTIMPTASASNLGQVVQYLGETTSVAPIYTNGYFYKCVAQGTDPETYAWEAQPVQEGGSGADSRIKEEITAVKVNYETTRDFRFVPIISIGLVTLLTRNGRSITTDDLAYAQELLTAGRITQAEYADVIDAFEIPSFSTASWDVIKSVTDAYYNGSISKDKITDAWSVGDTKTIHIDAMSATTGDIKVDESHEAQDMVFRIVDFDHDTLETAIGGKTKALMSLHSVDCFKEAGAMGVSNPYVWENTPRRLWLNNVLYNALPQEVRAVIKPVKKADYQSVEKVFFPTLRELGIDGETADSRQNTGTTTTPYSYHIINAGNNYRIKKQKNANITYLSSPLDDEGTYRATGVITDTGAANGATTATILGLAPALCI
jgi:hypothetical protein